jgi:hypothetical protein
LLFADFELQKLPPQAAGNFLLIGKKSPKNDFYCSHGTLSADSTSVLLAADARIPARVYPRYKPAGDWYQASCNPSGTKPWSVAP